MSKQIEANPQRISFNPKGLDIPALDEIAAERGMSRAELIREAVQEILDDAANGYVAHDELHKPDEDELREAYERLLELSDHPLGPRPVSVEEAKDQLWTQNCGKSSVKRRLLEPLAALGFIGVNNGHITVHRRTIEHAKRVEAAADDEFERFEAADRPSTEYRKVEPMHKELLKYQRAQIPPPFDLVAWTASRILWPDNGATG